MAKQEHVFIPHGLFFKCVCVFLCKIICKIICENIYSITRWRIHFWAAGTKCHKQDHSPLPPRLILLKWRPTLGQACGDDAAGREPTGAEAKVSQPDGESAARPFWHRGAAARLSFPWGAPLVLSAGGPDARQSNVVPPSIRRKEGLEGGGEPRVCK